MPFFEPGAYLLDLRPARSSITVDRVTFLLPNAAPPSLSDLADDVDLLLERGALNQGTANALHSTLNAATRQRYAGNNAAAIGSLGAFIDELNA